MAALSGVGCSKGATAIGGRLGSDVHGYCGGGQQRYGARDDCCCVQFVAGHDQDSWQRTIVASCDVNRLQRKIAAGSFLPQGWKQEVVVGSVGQRKMRATGEGIREIGRLKNWWTKGCDFLVRFVAVLGEIWGYDFVEFRLRIGVVLGW
ncbi:hypothetical protein B296_00031694 [Ensete ventricosum]|uniref:Uncharacterized protein n=1 Tax=Ensete ventricosum TaxID=4639 RepID=A0A426XBQ7_ENSVE|nr:hypothetical protein B296_00031694 [Ensete ventricosum]